jgi:hypothetical protein
MVMIFNNINKSTKLEILEENTPTYEKEVYEVLIKLGIDPETFDESAFEESTSLDPTDLSTIELHKRLRLGIDALAVIQKEISNLEV